MCQVNIDHKMLCMNCVDDGFKDSILSRIDKLFLTGSD